MSDDEDELPPWLGERFRDITFQLFRGAHEAAKDEDTTHG